MIIKNVTKSSLKYLRLNSNYNNGDYTIVNSYAHSKEVCCPLPRVTYRGCKEGHYLEKYRKYYGEFDGFCYELKSEYIKNNRIYYSYTIHYNTYDIELTKQGANKVQSRYNSHKRWMERYATLLPAE